VFGAGGAVGEAAAHALMAGGWHVTASLRTRRRGPAERLVQNGAAVRYDDLEGPGGWSDAAATCEAIVFTTQLGLTNVALARMSVAKQRIVAFSSNNVAIQPDAQSYVDLAAAERSLRARHPGAAIIRPTLIYGDPRLPTLTRLMRIARAWPFVPMPGTGLALVQPVFHEDLGRAAAWLAGTTGEGTYAIGGPDSVTMRGLYRAVIRAAGSKARIVPVSETLLRWGAPMLTLLNLYSSEQTVRVDREIVAKVGLKEGLAHLAAALGTPPVNQAGKRS